ncbi:nucleotidyl transferase AbiEii/AbiGii toxin family protein [Verrucomicrobiota bacterium]
MLDVNRHKFLMLQILKDIYSDTELAPLLGFKGGTALMFFHDLPRFSVDLDFNLLQKETTQQIYKKTKEILIKYGEIIDEAQKHFGIILVLNYEQGERNLKVEISNRQYPDRYELKDYLGISINVMVLEDMFTHKLMALLGRNVLTNRDIFDCWFYMNKRIIPNRKILKQRLTCSFPEYLDACRKKVSQQTNSRILHGMGELMDPDLKKWVKQNLIKEFLLLVEFYKTLNLTDS